MSNHDRIFSMGVRIDAAYRVAEMYPVKSYKRVAWERHATALVFEREVMISRLIEGLRGEGPEVYGPSDPSIQDRTAWHALAQSGSTIVR